MKPQPKMRYAGAFAVLLALLAVLFVWNVNSGSLHLSVREVAQILLTHSGDNAVIVWEIRLPRTLGAWSAGALLGLAVPGVELDDLTCTTKTNPMQASFCCDYRKYCG